VSFFDQHLFSDSDLFGARSASSLDVNHPPSSQTILTGLEDPVFQASGSPTTHPTSDEPPAQVNRG
jgi:hypothetical protein